MRQVHSGNLVIFLTMSPHSPPYSIFITHGNKEREEKDLWKCYDKTYNCKMEMLAGWILFSLERSVFPFTSTLCSVWKFSDIGLVTCLKSHGL